MGKGKDLCFSRRDTNSCERIQPDTGWIRAPDRGSLVVKADDPDYIMDVLGGSIPRMKVGVEKL
jgi:hypothetical protein